MHHLQFDVLRHTVTPQPCTVDACRFAFKDLDIRCTGDLTVDVGPHPGVIWVLKHRMDATYLVTRTACVMRRHDGFQHIAPIHGAGFIVGVVLGQQVLATGLLHPQLQLGLVGVEAHSSSSI